MVNFPHLYMGFVALSLNQRMRKTSPHPDGDWTSQGNTAVVPWRPFTCDTGTESIIADSAQTGYCTTFPCLFVCQRRDISSFLDNLIV